MFYFSKKTTVECFDLAFVCVSRLLHLRVVHGSPLFASTMAGLAIPLYIIYMSYMFIPICIPLHRTTLSSARLLFVSVYRLLAIKHFPKLVSPPKSSPPLPQYPELFIHTTTPVYSVHFFVICECMHMHVCTCVYVQPRPPILY